MRGVLEYRALMDLRKGWRVTLPNLEQVGLIQVRYPLAPRAGRAGAEWADAHHGFGTRRPVSARRSSGSASTSSAASWPSSPMP